MPKFGEAQWALGYMEPQNKNERTKRDDDALNVRQRIDTIYAQGGFRSIWPDDLRGRFRWWGLYTQRRQGVPGGATASVEPWELEDEFFMMRIRLAGGRLTSEQLRTIAWVSERFGRDVADVSDRQNIQLHWIRIEDVPRIFEAIEAVGLTTCEACGDCPRAFLGCPLAGVDRHEILDGTPSLLAIHQRFVGDPTFSNLPRKYKTSVSGCTQQCAAHEINDISFVGVLRNGQPGFDLWVGGGLGSNPHFAKRLGAFVEPCLVEEVWAGVTGCFRDYGYRRARNHARLKFLMADWGPVKFREVVEKEYLGFSLPDVEAAPPSTTTQRDHVGVYEQNDGDYYVGFAPRAGRIYGHQLRQVAEFADIYGCGRVTLTTQQKMVIPGVPEGKVDELVAALEDHDLRVRPSAFRRSTMACTGIEFCKLALVETKHRADWLYRELEERMPEFDEPIRINLNGCPNSCARFQLADIGFMGCLGSASDGTKVDHFQVHVGGHLGEGHTFGRKVKRLKVPASELANYCERVLRRFQSTRHADEPFHSWAARAPEPWLL
ncbi:MAG TPA: nitrite/sulfite reductase [Actinomycetota bacterium]|nr:nitrite/sulfite reductase [Actinomycetota bacterium]